MANSLQKCLAVVAVVLVVTSADPDCRGFKCPKITGSSEGSGYTLRSYAPSTWVGVTEITKSSSANVNGMFMKLFKYISDHNIKMTVPVVTKVEDKGNGKFENTMMFYVAVNDPPTPSASNMKIINMPAKDFFVRDFTRFLFLANNKMYRDNVGKLRKSIGSESLYDTKTYYQVGYSSPWWPPLKYHEVWVEAL